MSNEASRSRQVLVTLSVLIALAMCIPSSSLSADVPSAETPLVFRVGTTGDISTFNPFMAVRDLEGLMLELMYDSLTGVQADFTPGPRLAESWYCDSSGLVWTFNITSGALWHDGEPVTADDVAFTFNVILDNPDECALWADALVGVEEVTATSEYVVSVTTGVPTAKMPGYQIPILPEHLWSSVDPSSLANVDPTSSPYFPDGPVGSGPFVFSDYVAYNYVQLTAFEDYHGGVAEIDEIIFSLMSSDATMVSSLSSGGIDLAYDVPLDLWDTAMSGDDVDGQAAKLQRLKYLSINCASESMRTAFPKSSDNLETTNLSVRRAIAHAVDRAFIVDTIHEGLVEPGETLIPGVSSYWHYDVPVEDEMPFDLGLAADILEVAGYTDSDMDGVRENSTSGVPLAFDLYCIQSEVYDLQMAYDISDWLWDIGVNATVVPVSIGVLYSVWLSCEFDMLLWEWDPGRDADPGFLLRVMTTYEIPTAPTDWAKWSDSYYSNAYYDSLYDLQAVTTDPVERQAIVHYMQEILYFESPYIVMCYPQALFAYRTDTFGGYPDLSLDPAASPSYMRFYLEVGLPYENLPPTAVLEVTPEEGYLATVFYFDASDCNDAHDNVSDLEVRWDWEDDGTFDTPWSTDKVASHQYSSPGIYTVRLQVSDTLGETDETTKDVTVVDDEAPVTEMLRSIEETDHGWYPGNVTVTLVATDNSGEVMWTNYTLDDSDWVEYSEPFLVSGEGEHVIEYFSVDPSMNAELPHIDSIYIDYTLPTLEISFEGEEGSEPLMFSSSVTVTVESLDETSELLSLEVCLDGGAWMAYGATIVVSDEGEHSIEASAVDHANNTVSTEVDFVIDKTAPETEAECDSEPSDEGWYNSAVVVTLEAEDALSGVHETWYRLDTGMWTLYTSEFAVSEDGSHLVEFYSVDYAGNTGMTEQLSLAIDGTAPTVTFITSGDATTLVYECVDDTSGILYSEYSLDGGEWVDSGSASSVLVPVGTDGDHSITVRAYDGAGNVLTVTHEFTVESDDSDILILMIAVPLAAVLVVVVVIVLLLLKKRRAA